MGADRRWLGSAGLGRVKAAQMALMVWCLAQGRGTAAVAQRSWEDKGQQWEDPVSSVRRQTPGGHDHCPGPGAADLGPCGCPLYRTVSDQPYSGCGQPGQEARRQDEQAAEGSYGWPPAVGRICCGLENRPEDAESTLPSGTRADHQGAAPHEGASRTGLPPAEAIQCGWLGHRPDGHGTLSGYRGMERDCPRARCPPRRQSGWTSPEVDAGSTAGRSLHGVDNASSACHAAKARNTGATGYPSACYQDPGASEIPAERRWDPNGGRGFEGPLSELSGSCSLWGSLGFCGPCCWCHASCTGGFQCGSTARRECQ